MSYKVEIGKNIVSLRKLKQISQEQLALGSEMSISYLRAIEHGRANPTLDALSRLAATLDVPLATFFVLSWEEPEILAAMHPLNGNSESPAMYKGVV